MLLKKLNDIKISKEICLQYLSKNNKDIVSLNILGQCFFAEKNYNEAVKVFNSILEDHMVSNLIPLQ